MPDVNSGGDLVNHYTESSSVQELREGLLSSLLVMAWVVEARDPYTGGHLWRVSQMARIVAQAAGLSVRDVERLAVGGFLHDLGKVGVPDHILGKKDRLTEDEFAIIKTHPDIGWNILFGHPLAAIAEQAVRSHHEMPNGRGYPQGLSGEAIPLEARIVGVCDAFDAMTSTRPYRAGMPIEKALSIIESNLGSQFDTVVGGHFIALGRQGRFQHIVAHSDDGIPLQVCNSCGPTVVLRRDQSIGEHTYCHACHAQFTVQEDARGAKHAIATGKFGSATDLVSLPDTGLLNRLIAQSREVTRS